LEFTEDPLTIQISVNNNDDYLKKLISSLGKINIENLNNTEFQNISITSDLFILLTINTTITGNPKLTLDLGSVPFYLENTSMRLSPTQCSINLMDNYNLAQIVKDAINNTSQTSNTGNILMFLIMLANLIIGSQAGLLLKGLMLNDLIHLTKFININYPPNIIYLYLTRTSMSSWIDLPKIDDSNNFDIPPILRLYNISPYFLNNFGKELFQISLTYAIGLLCYVFFKNIVDKVKRFVILKNLYYFFAWDYTMIYMVSNFTKILVFGLIKLRFSLRFQTISEKIDLISAILMLTFCLLLIFHFYLKISTNFSGGIFSASATIRTTNHSPDYRKSSINFNTICPIPDAPINTEPKEPKFLPPEYRKSSINFNSISPLPDIQFKTEPKEKEPKFLYTSTRKESFRPTSLTIRTSIFSNAANSIKMIDTRTLYPNHNKFEIPETEVLDHNPKDTGTLDPNHNHEIPETGMLDPNQNHNQIDIPETGLLDPNRGEMTDKAISNSFDHLKTEHVKLKEIYVKTSSFLRRKSVDLMKYIYVENLEERNNNILNLTKKDREIHKYYLIIELIRYILLTVFGILLYGFPLVQILLIFISNMLFFLLTAFSNPFKKRYMFIATIVNEFLINGCFLICLVLTSYDFNGIYISLDTKMNLGWVFIAVDLFLLYFMFLYNVFRIARGLFEKLKKKKKGVYPEVNIMNENFNY